MAGINIDKVKTEVISVAGIDRFVIGLKLFLEIILKISFEREDMSTLAWERMPSSKT
jgi:hypothetical protein